MAYQLGEPIARQVQVTVPAAHRDLKRLDCTGWPDARSRVTALAAGYRLAGSISENSPGTEMPVQLGGQLRRRACFAVAQVGDVAGIAVDHAGELAHADPARCHQAR